MTLIYIFWGEYAGFRDVLACAKARAGCPIVVVSDGPAPSGVTHFQIQVFSDAERVRKLMEETVGEWEAKCLGRWFVLRDILRNRPEWFPVFCSDWDILIFQNLAQAYIPFMEYNYTVSISDRVSSATYAINAPDIKNDAAHGIAAPGVLETFCETIEAMFTMNDPCVANYNDMAAWHYISQTNRFKVGNLNTVINGSIFDHNMHCGDKEFVFDGPAKKVTFTDGNPFFQLLNGDMVKANTLHCWGTYKTRTEEMRKLAGIPL